MNTPTNEELARRAADTIVVKLRADELLGEHAAEKMEAIILSFFAPQSPQAVCAPDALSRLEAILGPEPQGVCVECGGRVGMDFHDVGCSFDWSGGKEETPVVVSDRTWKPNLARCVICTHRGDVRRKQKCPTCGCDCEFPQEGVASSCPWCACPVFSGKLTPFAIPTDGSGNKLFQHRCPKCKTQAVITAKSEEQALVLWNTRAEVAQNSPGEAKCADCGHTQMESNFHFDAKGEGWGAALHWFKNQDSLLTEEEAQLVIGAIPLQAFPDQDLGRDAEPRMDAVGVGKDIQASDAEVFYPGIVDQKTLAACLETAEQIIRDPRPDRVDRFRLTKAKLIAQVKAHAMSFDDWNSRTSKPVRGVRADSDLSPGGPAASESGSSSETTVVLTVEDRLQKIRQIADLGSASEFGDAIDRLEAIVKIAG